MTDEQYLKQRIKNLEENIHNKNLPMKQRINQAKALSFYLNDLEALQNKADISD